METHNSTYRPVAAESAVVRATFIRKTYMHLALAVALFAGIEYVLLQIPIVVETMLATISGFSWILVIFAFMFVTNFAESLAARATSKATQYAAFGLFVLAEALIFLPIIFIGIATTGSVELIAQAGTLTLFLFTGITAVVFITGEDFSMLRSILSIGGMLAIGLIVGGWAFGFTLGLWFSILMVGLAAGAILYQTSQIMYHYHTEQYVAASLGLFGAIMLMFWYILRIMSSD